MKIIPLGREGQYETIVSDEDYDFLMQWRWNYKVSQHKYARLIYARRGGGRSSGGNQPTILMHHVILERMGQPRPEFKITCDHNDNKTLNNQRCNLSWATKSQQSANQRRYKEAEHGLEAIPF